MKIQTCEVSENKRGSKPSLGEGVGASFPSPGVPVVFPWRVSALGEEEKVPSRGVPQGRLQASSSRDEQQSPLVAKATQSHPEPSPSSFQPCTGSWWVTPSAWDHLRPVTGALDQLPERGAHPSPGLSAQPEGRGRCPGLGVPEGIVFPAHLRPDVLAGSQPPALLCLSPPRLRCH